MLTSFAFIFLLGMSLGFIVSKLKLPSLLGMLLTGILLGPFVLDLIDPAILNASSDLRQIALIIILTRAGLSLDLNTLRSIGRPALLMCFLPALFEITAITLLSARFLQLSYLEGAIMGSVVAAVSPAVIVPRMIRFTEEGYGTDKSIPQLIMAGASVDDVFVIVLFSSLLALNGTNSLSPGSLARVPAAIISGIAIGAAVGWLLQLYFRKAHVRDSAKVIMLLCISFLLVSAEKKLEPVFSFSGLLAVMMTGIVLLHYYPALARRLSAKYSKLWVGAEVLLFVLVGASVDLKYAWSFGYQAIAFILLALLCRMIGVFCCLIGTRLNYRERLFCSIAYLPKATVQAAIGGIPLAMGLPCGKIVLTAAVLSILITAPLGAFGIDLLYKKCLAQPED